MGGVQLKYKKGRFWELEAFGCGAISQNGVFLGDRPSYDGS